MGFSVQILFLQSIVFFPSLQDLPSNAFKMLETCLENKCKYYAKQNLIKTTWTQGISSHAEDAANTKYTDSIHQKTEESSFEYHYAIISCGSLTQFFDAKKKK